MSAHDCTYSVRAHPMGARDAWALRAVLPVRGRPVGLVAVGEISRDDHRVTFVVMRGHGQIQWRGGTVHDATCEVVARAVTGAEKPPRPVCAQSCGVRIWTIFRDAAQVRADSDQQQIFRSNGTLD